MLGKLNCKAPLQNLCRAEPRCAGASQRRVSAALPRASSKEEICLVVGLWLSS